MSFLDQKTKQTLLLTYNNKTVLQTCPNMTYFFNNHPNPNDSERTSVSALHFSALSVLCSRLHRTNKKKQLFSASMTVEAACAMPIFLFAILNLICLMEIFQIQMCLQAALHQSAKEMAVYGYAYEKMQNGASFLAGTVGQVVFSETYVRKQVNDYVTKSVLDASCIEGGSAGITYSLSKIMEEDCIELVALYRISPRFSLVAYPKTFTLTQVKVRAFTGYDNTEGNRKGSENEEVVFVAESGSAYHINRGCSHLKLSIQLTKKKELPTLRNVDGKRYKACQKCDRSTQAEEILVVTNLGDSYHTNIRCSGIKRTIDVISLTEAKKSYRPCTRCVRE